MSSTGRTYHSAPTPSSPRHWRGGSPPGGPTWSSPRHSASRPAGSTPGSPARCRSARTPPPRSSSNSPGRRGGPPGSSSSTAMAATPPRSPGQSRRSAPRVATCCRGGRASPTVMLMPDVPRRRCYWPSTRPRRSAAGGARGAPTARRLAPELRRQGVRAVSPSGVLGDPTGATLGEGRDLLDKLTSDLVAAVDDARNTW